MGTTRGSKASRILPCVLAMSVVCGSPGQSEEGEWRVRVFGFYMETADSPVLVDEAGTVLSSDNDYGAGLGISAEYLLTPRLGLGLALTRADHGDFFPDEALPEAEVVATGTMGVTTLSAGLDYHLTPESAADVYVGALLAVSDYGSFGIRYDPAGELPDGATTSSKLEVDTDLGFGVELGMDLALDEHWIFHAVLRYLLTSIEGSGSGVSMAPVDYDPVTIGAGFGYRF